MKAKISLSIILFIFPLIAFAQSSSFSFQGRLNDGALPANGQYDAEFRLYNAVSGGTQIGSTVSRPATILINGVFSVSLDFGATAFSNANSVFIEVAVKPANSPNTFTILGPRQRLTVVPLAVQATRADFATSATSALTAGFAQNAETAGTATTAANALSLGGTDASAFPKLNVVNTGDLRTNGALAITGDAFQPITANGFAKGMIEVTNVGSIHIAHCFNGIANLSTGNCGFVLSSPLTGVFRIDFGFPISDRFIVALPQYADTAGVGDNNSGISYRKFNSTTIEFFTYTPNEPTDTRPRTFTAVLF